MHVDEVEEVALRALDLLLEGVHHLVLDVEHVLAQVDHLLRAVRRPAGRNMQITVQNKF